ncbi:hypothetical protein D3C77_529960 [compost metagenome]
MVKYQGVPFDTEPAAKCEFFLTIQGIKVELGGLADRQYLAASANDYPFIVHRHTGFDSAAG